MKLFKKKKSYFVAFICTQISKETNKAEQVYANMVIESEKPIKSVTDVLSVQEYILKQLGDSAINPIIVGMTKLN